MKGFDPSTPITKQIFWTRDESREYQIGVDESVDKKKSRSDSRCKVLITRARMINMR